MAAALNRRLAADLDAAFPMLVDTYGPMVLAITRRLGDPSTAEDLTQNVFLAVFRALTDYDENRIVALELRPWLATIARNQLRNEYRRRSRKPVAPLSDVEPTTNDAAHEDVDHRIMATHLDAHLRRLPEPQRTAIVLRHVAGHSTKETADVMNCPQGTVKSHLSRGLTELRNLLDIEKDSQP